MLKTKCRPGSLAFRSLLVAAACGMGAQVGAQEIVHTFKNPSFGGNPFYSEHLRAIAEFDRPPQPSTTPSPEDLLASQLRSQLTSSLSGNILTTIQNAKPGDKGSFTLGNQVIDFTRTETETRVTFTNSKTGETSELVIPVVKPTNPSPFSTLPAAGLGSPLGALPMDGRSVSGESTGPEIPLGPPPL